MSATYAPFFANGFSTTTKGAHTLAWGQGFRIGERRLLGENIAIAWKLQSELLQRRFWVDSIMNTGSNELRHRSDLIFAEDRLRLAERLERVYCANARADMRMNARRKTSWALT